MSERGEPQAVGSGWIAARVVAAIVGAIVLAPGVLLVIAGAIGFVHPEGDLGAPIAAIFFGLLGVGMVLLGAFLAHLGITGHVSTPPRSRAPARPDLPPPSRRV